MYTRDLKGGTPSGTGTDTGKLCLTNLHVAIFPWNLLVLNLQIIKVVLIEKSCII